MSHVTTHVLDAATGRPAVGVPVMLQSADGEVLGSSVTNADGRAAGLALDSRPVGEVLPS